MKKILWLFIVIIEFYDLEFNVKNGMESKFGVCVFLKYVFIMYNR